MFGPFRAPVCPPLSFFYPQKKRTNIINKPEKCKCNVVKKRDCKWFDVAVQRIVHGMASTGYMDKKIQNLFEDNHWPEQNSR